MNRTRLEISSTLTERQPRRVTMRRDLRQEQALRENSVRNWRRIGRQYAADYGLDGSALELQAKETFKAAIVKIYYDELGIALPAGWKKIDLAKKYDIDKSTAGRLLNGQIPSFPNACVIAAANDAIFPRGCDAALTAYCETFNWLQTTIARTTREILTHEEALVLFYVIRSPEWEMSVRNRDSTGLQETAEEILRYVGEYIEKPTIRSAEGIQRVIGIHMATWALLESLVTHEWF